MTSDRLTRRHPTLFHMADARNWASIERFGLLSTSSLLDRYEVARDERTRIEFAHRPETVTIASPTLALGPAFVRDQRPLDPAVLPTALTDMTPTEWLATLNARVFFWPTRDRLNRMLQSYLDHEQAVFEIDTARFLARHGDQVELSHINSGYASRAYKPAARGSATFCRLADYLDSSRNAVAEVTVPGGVSDIFDCTIRVVGRWREHPDRLIWGEPIPDDASDGER